MGAPVEARGFGVEAAPSSYQPEDGAALRRLVLDPLRPHLEGATDWIVALDDVLHLVPLDALPDADGCLGDRVRIHVRTSLRELLWEQPLSAAGGGLVALGGVDYDSEPHEGSALAALATRGGDGLEEPGETGRRAARRAHSVLSGGPWQSGFPPLSATGAEASGVGDLFSTLPGEDERGVLLCGSMASRSRLEPLAERARYLHLATHGWFAPGPEEHPGQGPLLDAQIGYQSGLTAGSRVERASPLLLCGLALAGANRPADAAGRRDGLVTAEEIAGWDLHRCELAVLSACDTNVGIARAGQGVASLQKALHMAGARSVVTSLWKVPDEATKELMLDFYRRLWVEKKPKHQALWEAKTRLRQEKDARGSPRYGLRDWGAWVLTGDPE
jgi:CHAT domain-containing protein